MVQPVGAFARKLGAAQASAVSGDNIARVIEFRQRPRYRRDRPGAGAFQ
jgi:hypothetical protein